MTLAEGSAPSELSVTPASAVYGDTISVSAMLTASGTPLAGETVNFTFTGLAAVTGVTDGSGRATVSGVRLVGTKAGANTIRAAFAGDATHAIANGTADLQIAFAVPTIV
jgi:hypothetical protein